MVPGTQATAALGAAVEGPHQLAPPQHRLLPWDILLLFGVHGMAGSWGWGIAALY